MPVTALTGQLYSSLAGGRGEYKFGFNPDVDIGTVPEDVWDAGGTYTWPLAAGVTQIVSTSPNDTAGGTGLRRLRIIGLDAAFNVISNDVAMGGVAPLILPQQYYRINRMYGLEGTSPVGTNLGTITATIGGTLASQINIGRGQTLQTIYTVPNYAGVSAVFLKGWSCAVGRQVAAQVSVALLTRDDGTFLWRTRDIIDLVTTGTSFVQPQTQADCVCFQLQPGTDMRIEVQATTINDVAVSGTFELEFVPGP